MNARGQPCAKASFENTRGFFRGEDAGLAEDVAPFCDALGRDRGNHLVDHEVHVSGTIGAMFRWHVVSPEKRGDHVDWMPHGDRRQRPQYLQLALGVESVSAL